MVGINEASQQNLNPHFRLYGVYDNAIAPQLSLEGGLGFAKLSSLPNVYSAYSTTIFPIDLRVRYSPLNDPKLSAYLYAGFGIVPYSVSSPSSGGSGVSGYVPVGIGISVPLTKVFTVDVNIGVNPSLTDKLNPVLDGRKDGFWGFNFGFTWTFGPKNKPLTDAEYDFGGRGTLQIFRDIVFDSATARLQPESDTALTTVLNSLNDHSEIEIQIRAYTDNSGDFNTEMQLTQERAESIKVWLVTRGVSPERITTQGFGPHNPVMPNDTPEHRLLNYRIEVVRMK
jgi:outer membrane protein OmpA-like peptidoglycan-associated protein